MTAISLMSANFVARELGYHMTEGWGQGDKATNARFQPLETFGARFGDLLGLVRSLGFEAIDLWLAHLHWRWATPAHIAQARALLTEHGLTVASLGGTFGSTPEEFGAACRLATALGTTILGGSAPLLATDRGAVVAALREHGLRLGLENHPGMLTPDEILARIGDGGQGSIGVTVDTGWFGTAGLNAVEVIETLGSHIVHVHLKDVLAQGSHVTCGFGQGCVDVAGCVQALQRIGYRGGLSVEHEPEDHDPSEECRASLALLRTYLGQA